MAFFDRLSKAAKNVAAKGADTLEITRLNGKIMNEKAAMETVKTKIGDYYWRLFEDGHELDEEVTEMCLEIKDIQESIDMLQGEIDTINQKAKKVEEDETPEEAPMVSGIKCPNCGTLNEIGTKFCRECGTRLEPVPAPEPVLPVDSATHCHNCGAENPLGTKFCRECGAKMDTNI